MSRAVQQSQAKILLCADDYALTNGISDAIEQLAHARRLSATSVMTTSRHWPAHAARIAALRGKLAVGLHFNLTLGAPLGPMPRLAPRGNFPVIGDLTGRAVRGALDIGEIEQETDRQLAAFEDAVGFPPDFLDGHQHVHALPGVRKGVLAALKRRYAGRGLLVRDPADHISRIVMRSVAVSKALTLSALSRGFGAAARHAGFVTNDSFAGVSGFSVVATALEFKRSVDAPGHFHIVMCHPGFVDDELVKIDPVTDRRQAEFELLMQDAGWQQRIWHPDRPSDGPSIDWRNLELAGK